MHQRGVFVVARFDNQGNAKAFLQWNECQDWLHVFCIYVTCVIIAAKVANSTNNLKLYG